MLIQSNKQKEIQKSDMLDPGYCGRAGQSVSSSGLKPKLMETAKKILRPIYKRWRHSLVYLICMIRKDYQGIIYVDPKHIRKTVNCNDSTLKKNNMWHFGSVSVGDWDLDGVPVDVYGGIFPILKQKVEQKKDYDDITEFRENLKRIQEGERPDNCASERQYREKWKRIEDIYHQLKANGYKSQKELKSGYPFNEIRVQVGRQGGLLFEEGMHRLVISRILKLKKIPVIITRRHAEWVRENGKKIYREDNLELL